MAFALDDDWVLLREIRDRVRARLELLGAPFSENTYLFAGVKTPDDSVPYSPHAV